MSDILDSIDDLLDDGDDITVDGEMWDISAEEIEFVDPVDDLESILVVDGEMNIEQAREITAEIQSTGTALWSLLLQAHSGKAYKALGYNTWEDYVDEEINISVSRSYQLMSLGKAVLAIEAAAPEGTEVKLTEAQARDIKRALPRITERVEEGSKGMSPDEAADFIDRVVQEEREQKKEEDKVLAQKEKARQEAEEEAHRKELERQADELLAEADERGYEPDQPSSMTDNADDGFVEVEVSGNGDASPTDAANLYNFVNALNSVANLPDPEDFLHAIPQSRFDDLYSQAMDAAEFFNRIVTLMEEQRD